MTAERRKYVPAEARHKNAELSASIKLNPTTEYILALKQNKLTPEKLENFWENFYIPYRDETDLKLEITRFPDTAKEIRKYSALGMIPIPVPDEIVGPDGMKNLKNMYWREIDMYDVPQIENKIKHGGWRYVQINTDITKKELENELPGKKIVDGDFPSHVTLAVHLKKITNKLPDQMKLATKENRNITVHTVSRLGGSYINPGISVNEVKNEVAPGTYFGAGSRLVVVPLKPGMQVDGLINRHQILATSVQPSKIA